MASTRDCDTEKDDIKAVTKSRIEELSRIWHYINIILGREEEFVKGVAYYR